MTLRDLPPGEPPGDAIHIDFEGERIPAFTGEPIAVALHAAGIDTLGRSPKYHRPRGLFCLEGHCASCFLRIDGRPNQRSCVTAAREGIVCERQNAFPSADVDLLAAADWLFPEGMDHHTMMTGSKAGNALFLKLVREMGGSGTLPDAPPDEAATMIEETVDVCIVGAGPAGLAAARAVAETAPGARVIVFDEQRTPGGSLHAEAGGSVRARTLTGAALAAGAEILPGAVAIGYFPEDEAAGGERGLLGVATQTTLRRVRARHTLYATGSYDQNLPFEDNDRPGIVSARACGRLAFRWGVRPVGVKRRVLVVGDAPTATPLVAGLTAAGVAAARVPVKAIGKRRKGDLVAVAALPAPASELARQHGAEVAFDAGRGGFAVVADKRGATNVAGVWACGDVTGYVGTAAAERAGAAVGKALAAQLARRA
jgi:sarcosine oxidase subunit alpha